MEKLIEELKTTAKQKMLSDDSDFDTSCGGNYDNAYYTGCADGEIYLARKILTDLNISWK